MTITHAAVMTTEERTAADKILADLHASGYRDVEQLGTLKPGTRIRHVGHQWSAACTNGTGVILAITEKPDSSWSQDWHMPDVELIALWDPAVFGHRLSQLAQYHVEAVGGVR